MISVKVIGTAQVIGKIKKAYPSIMEELRAYCNAFAIATVGYVRDNKLSGQMLNLKAPGNKLLPLGQRSGKLKDSITFRVDSEENTIAAVVGTNVEYAAIHEFGFNGPESVRAHLRRHVEQHKMLVTGKLSKKTWAVPKSEGSIQVKAFTREMNMPERSFLRSTLAERKEEFRQGLMAATNKAVENAT